MNQKILYKIPSKRRPEGLIETIKSITDNSAQLNHEFLIIIDHGDSSYTSLVEAIRLFGSEVKISFAITPGSGKINAFNYQNTIAWDILVCPSDDMIFTKFGFDNIIRKNCGSDNFLHFPEPYKQAAVSVLSVMGRHYYERFNYVYHRSYQNVFCDNEATEVAKILRCYKFVPDEIFVHNHPSANGQASYAANRLTWGNDKRNFYRRRGEGFNLGVERDPRLLIKYPTRGRWRLFFEGINNIYSTIRTNNFEVLVTADEDDVEMNNAEVRNFCKRFLNLTLNYGPRTTKIDAVNRDTPTGSWDWALVYSDDMRFQQFDWDGWMLRDIHNVWRDNKDWFAHFNDGFVAHKLPTMHIVSYEYWKRDGYFYQPGYKSVSCDAEAMYVAQMRGRYHYFDKIYFKHLHPANLHQPSDRTYRENDKYGDGDTKHYFERMARGFDVKDPIFMPEEVKKIMECPVR